MEKYIKITEAEMEVMKEIWNCNEMVNIAELTSILNAKGKMWAYQTVATFLKNLKTKNMIDSCKKGKVLYYFPIVPEEKYKTKTTENFLNTHFSGSLKNFLIAFTDSKHFTAKELKEFREWFDSIDK